MRNSLNMRSTKRLLVVAPKQGYCITVIEEVNILHKLIRHT